MTQALDDVTDSFFLVSSDWTIQHVNARFERNLHRSRAEFVGRNLWEAVPGMVGTPFESEMRLAMESAAPRVFEIYSQSLGLWLQPRAFPCNGGLAVLTIDITDRKIEEFARADIEHELVQAQRLEALGTLASGIAHDFNNILGVILGHAGLMRDLLPQRSPARQNLEQIRMAGERARDLVHQILAHSHAATREFVRQPLRPLLEESLQLLRSTLPACVRLSVSLTHQPLAATVNPSEVQQMVMNLCTNAWHALPAEGGSIAVELRSAELENPAQADVGQLAPGMYAEIVVSDSGTGLTEEARARLFEPFFTTKARGHGTGLGLHVLNGIVMAHGGAVVVESELGRGSRFSVYLPATPLSDVEAVAVPAVNMASAAGESVAYVDDDEVVRLMVGQVLERTGFSVSSFSDPLQLLEALRTDSRRYDLLVTDYSMPGLNGLQLVREIRHLCPDLPIIIVSGHVADDVTETVAGLRNVEIVNKERTFEDLGPRAVRALQAQVGLVARE